MNLCTSAGESWIARLKGKLNKITYKLVALDPWNAGHGVSESPIFKNFRGGACSQNPLSVIGTFGPDSQLAFPVSSSAWCLISMPVTKKKQYLDKTNDDTESVWRRSLNGNQAVLDTVHVTNFVQSHHCRWRTDSFTFVRVVSSIFFDFRRLSSDLR